MELTKLLKVYVLTADTFGSVKMECAGIDAEFVIIDQVNGRQDKEAFVDRIGAARTVAIGNGVNDVSMLAAAAVGIPYLLT